MILLIILTVIVIGISIFEKKTRKYLNPYKLYVIFAPKGTGKSVMLHKLAHYYKKLGYNIYCRYGDCDLPFVTQIDPNHIPYLAEAYYNPEVKATYIAWYTKVYKRPPTVTEMTPNSVMLHDEINLDWDNRDFKSFPKPVQEYFRLQRQYKHIYIGFSQTYDTDKKIRDLADYLVILDKKFRVYVTGKAYLKKPIAISPTEENNREDSKIVDTFVKMPWIVYKLKTPFTMWIPKWAKHNKTYREDQQQGKARHLKL